MTVIDADGHVTESQDQIARYLEEPFSRRPVSQFFYPWDGWDRRLLNTYSDLAGTADAWLRALDRGGMESAVLYPTLGLFMSFLKDRQWAVALCRAYNTFLHEEFVKKTTRLQAVALLPVQTPEACGPELRRAVRELGLCGAMLPADGGHLLAVSGLGCWRLLESEAGLHVLEDVDDSEGGTPVVERDTARVRIAPREPGPRLDGDALAELGRAAIDAVPPTTAVVRRYRRGSSPLVRDAARGYRSGNLDRVLAGGFDLG